MAIAQVQLELRDIPSILLLFDIASDLTTTYQSAA
jgi:hypothetical protein